jgi:hypothetical protein
MDFPLPDDLVSWASSVVRSRVDEMLLEQICCSVCGRGDREEVLLLCDGCQMGFHTFCLSPPLDEVPSNNNWMCEHCMDYDNIDSSSDEVVDELQQEHHQQVDAVAAALDDDGEFVPANVMKPFLRRGNVICSVCQEQPSEMFVLDAQIAAPRAGVVPKVPPSGLYVCVDCSGRFVEGVHAAQSAMLQQIKVCLLLYLFVFFPP